MNTEQALSPAATLKQPAELIEAYQQDKVRLCLSDPDVVLSQYGTERESSKDYQGRVIFEFFQNAIDRADQTVVIRLFGDELIIANDGEPFSIFEGSRDGKRSDFHSLCTIYNSSKKAGESIGNKGVGFKSVWSVSEAVKIESEDPSHGPWGFELFNPLKDQYFENADIREVLHSLDHKVPSFYFPKPVYDSAAPMTAVVGDGIALPVKTRITIKIINEAARADLIGQITELRNAQLFFLQLLGKTGFNLYTQIMPVRAYRRTRLSSISLSVNILMAIFRSA